MSVELGMLIGIILALLSVIAMVMPLRASPQSPIEDTSNRASLMAQRESAFQVLRDLDSDFEAGKLTEEDYRPMRVQSVAQTAEIMAQLDASEMPAKAPEPTRNAPVGRRKAPQSIDKYCPHCGAARDPADVYCRKCGKLLI